MANGWGPPSIDPGAISGILDPYIARQKEVRTGGAFSEGMDALTKGDYPRMARAMQVLATESPQMAQHLMSTYETEQARRRQEAQFQQTFAQTGRHQGLLEWIAANTPHPTGDADSEYGGGKAYTTPGFPPGYVSPFAAGGTATRPNWPPSPVRPAAPAPGPATPAPAPATPAPAAAAPATPAPAPEPTSPTASVMPGGNARAAVIQAVRSGLRGDELMKLLPPNWQLAVKQIANYERSPQDLSMRGTMQDRKLYEDLATAYDPTYNPGNYALVQKHLAGYSTTGGTGSGARLNNLNTAAGHVATMEELNALLAKGKFDIPALNAIYQKLNVALGGGVDVTNWNIMRSLVAPELAKVIGGASGLTGEERTTLANRIAASASPAQALGQIGTLKGAMAERYAVGHQQFNTETFGKRPYGFSNKLSGNSMKLMLDKEGVDVRTVAAGDLEKLLKNRDNKEALAAFDQHYGDGSSQRILDGLR